MVITIAGDYDSRAYSQAFVAGAFNLCQRV